jgi:hypothetical protein
VFIVMTIWSQPAMADWWDWFAELSGPGGFKGRGTSKFPFPTNVAATVYCQGSGWFKLLDNPDARGTCFFVDFRGFEAPEDFKFRRVSATVTEIGPTYRLAPPIEIGFGVGVMHFNSRFDTTGETRTADRMTVSFPRLVLKPLLLVPGLQQKARGNFGFLQVYFRETAIVGELNKKDDFLPLSSEPFQVRNDLVASTGVLIDVVGLFRLISKR